MISRERRIFVSVLLLVLEIITAILSSYVGILIAIQVICALIVIWRATNTDERYSHVTPRRRLWFWAFYLIITSLTTIITIAVLLGPGRYDLVLTTYSDTTFNGHYPTGSVLILLIMWLCSIGLKFFLIDDEHERMVVLKSLPSRLQVKAVVLTEEFRLFKRWSIYSNISMLIITGALLAFHLLIVFHVITEWMFVVQVHYIPIPLLTIVLFGVVDQLVATHWPHRLEISFIASVHTMAMLIIFFALTAGWSIYYEKIYPLYVTHTADYNVLEEYPIAFRTGWLSAALTMPLIAAQGFWLWHSSKMRSIVQLEVISQISIDIHSLPESDPQQKRGDDVIELEYNEVDQSI